MCLGVECDLGPCMPMTLVVLKRRHPNETRWPAKQINIVTFTSFIMHDDFRLYRLPLLARSLSPCLSMCVCLSVRPLLPLSTRSVCVGFASPCVSSLWSFSVSLSIQFVFVWSYCLSPHIMWVSVSVCLRTYVSVSVRLSVRLPVYSFSFDRVFFSSLSLIVCHCVAVVCFLSHSLSLSFLFLVPGFNFLLFIPIDFAF